jgi:hypothetical protein
MRYKRTQKMNGHFSGGVGFSDCSTMRRERILGSCKYFHLSELTHLIHHLHGYVLTSKQPYVGCLVAVSYGNLSLSSGEELTSSTSYENVLWNEFDNFVRPCPPGAPRRTQPKPDLTYAFPIQTSTPNNLVGFARDELTQALSLQSLGKLVERGVACAPTTAFRNGVNSPDRTRWSSSDRSCFPWAIVEMKKDVSASDDGAVERCYCQAANAAAAALDLQAQLFDKTNDSYSLRPPPVVAFTCVGPVVKVWLAYQDKPRIFGPTIQVIITLPHL